VTRGGGATAPQGPIVVLGAGLAGLTAALDLEAAIARAAKEAASDALSAVIGVTVDVAAAAAKLERVVAARAAKK